MAAVSEIGIRLSWRMIAGSLTGMILGLPASIRPSNAVVLDGNFGQERHDAIKRFPHLTFMGLRVLTINWQKLAICAGKPRGADALALDGADVAFSGSRRELPVGHVAV